MIMVPKQGRVRSKNHSGHTMSDIERERTWKGWRCIAWLPREGREMDMANDTQVFCNVLSIINTISTRVLVLLRFPKCFPEVKKVK